MVPDFLPKDKHIASIYFISYLDVYFIIIFSNLVVAYSDNRQDKTIRLCLSKFINFDHVMDDFFIFFH